MIFAGSGRWLRKSPTLRIQGRAREIGRTLSRSERSTPSSFASQLPFERNSAVSWPPTETIGTIGTPASRARRTKPRRPAKSTLPLSQVGRWTSQSPPG